MSSTQVKALLINNNPKDQILIRQLTDAFEESSIDLNYAHNIDSAKQQMQQGSFDILLINTEADISERLHFLNWLRNDDTNIPATLVINHSNDKVANQNCLTTGAIDSINIEKLTPALLERSIRYAIRHKADELRLLKLAHHDPLTGLYNRLAFKNHLNTLMAQSRRSGELIALMIIDLDNFKSVNDCLGHDIGDETLIAAANIIQNSVRETDQVARLGGDEFAVIATQLNTPHDAATLARFIADRCKITQTSSQGNITVSCSIGLALFPNDGDEINLLLKHADNALLHAKKSGKSQFSFADQQLNLKDKFNHILDNEINNQAFIKQLHLLYQPVVDVNNQNIISAEALLRWQNPSKGLLEPCHFLSAVENNGLMNKVANWVIHNACMQHLKWIEAGLAPIPISVNLTARQLESSYLINVIKKLINNQDFNPNFLHLELSEGEAFKCSDKVYSSLYKLRKLGVKLTIDKFGKDYCSITQLHRLPIDAIKIDRSLIQHLEHNNDYADVTEAIIQLGKILNLETIAHGVENERCLEYLNKRDCHHAQGFYISEPLTGDRFYQWAIDYNPVKISVI